MKIATTTEELNRYLPKTIDRVKKLYEFGFKYIDISFYNLSEVVSEFMCDEWEENVKELKDFALEKGIKYVQAHCPGINPICMDEKYDLNLKATIRSLEVCGMLGIPNSVFHVGWEKELDKDSFYRRNKEYILKLIPTLEKYNVNLCVENSCKSNLGKYFYFFDGHEMRNFIEYVGHKNVTACWDTGHANIEGHQYEDILALGDKLTALHINDNKGEKDEHMLPYMGTMNVDEVMTALCEIGYNGYFTFESGNALIWRKGWPHSRREFNENVKVADPDLECKSIFIKAQLTIGKSILSAYNCYED